MLYNINTKNEIYHHYAKIMLKNREERPIVISYIKKLNGVEKDEKNCQEKNTFK